VRSPNLITSFRYAFAGIGYELRTQRNLRIHVAIAVVVVIAGLWLGLSRWEWTVIALTVGFVLAAEMFNSALEAVVDLASPDLQSLAKIAKDVSAGAVVLAAATAVVVGLLVLGPHLVQRLG
jgi:diacylglycerol kinase